MSELISAFECTEFKKDIQDLSKILKTKDLTSFKNQIQKMYSKMQLTNTKEYYTKTIDNLCKELTGRTAQRLILFGF